MSLLTVRIPIASESRLEGRLVPLLDSADRSRVAASVRVRALRVLSTEPPQDAPFLRSVEIDSTGSPGGGSAPAPVATLSNQVRPDQPKQNIVDCGIRSGITLGGGVDWVLHANRPAPPTGVVLTLLLTLDD